MQWADVWRFCARIAILGAALVVCALLVVNAVSWKMPFIGDPGAPTDAAPNPLTDASVVPDRILIVPDEWDTSMVGTAEDGRRFFLTQPFDPGRAEYAAIFYWNADGSYNSIVVTDLGSRDDLDRATVDAAIAKLKEQLGNFTIEQISVAPFSEKHDGIDFGLVPYAGHDPAELGLSATDPAWVSVLPGDYIAYYWPWDGEYDT
jgi:hypothetical protein